MYSFIFALPASRFPTPLSVLIFLPRFAFFLSTANTAQFGYPSSHQAEVYCQTFRLSLVAMTVMAFAIFGVAGTAGYALFANWSVDPQNAKPATTTTPAKAVN